jgi:hypothetical protein
MTDCRSFYLHSKQNDFAEPTEHAQLDFTSIPFVDPANDNDPVKVRLLAPAGALFRRLAKLHRFESHTPERNNRT